MKQYILPMAILVALVLLFANRPAQIFYTSGKPSISLTDNNLRICGDNAVVVQRYYGELWHSFTIATIHTSQDLSNWTLVKNEMKLYDSRTNRVITNIKDIKIIYQRTDPITGDYIYEVIGKTHDTGQTEHVMTVKGCIVFEKPISEQTEEQTTPVNGVASPVQNAQPEESFLAKLVSSLVSSLGNIIKLITGGLIK